MDYKVIPMQTSKSCVHVSAECLIIGSVKGSSLNNVNPQSMMDDLYGNVNIHYHTYEEIFVEERLNFIQSVDQFFSFNEARQFMRFSGHYPHICSLHRCEGATAQLHGDSQQLAKLIAFLVTDFVKSRR